MATYNNKFLVKNGLAVGSTSEPISVIDENGNWVGATGILTGASGVSGASGYVGLDGATGVQGIDGATGYTGASGSGTTINLSGDVDLGTIYFPNPVDLDFGEF